jgi:hypothetical protein
MRPIFLLSVLWISFALAVPISQKSSVEDTSKDGFGLDGSFTRFPASVRSDSGGGTGEMLMKRREPGQNGDDSRTEWKTAAWGPEPIPPVIQSTDKENAWFLPHIERIQKALHAHHTETDKILSNPALAGPFSRGEIPLALTDELDSRLQVGKPSTSESESPGIYEVLNDASKQLFSIREVHSGEALDEITDPLYKFVRGAYGSVRHSLIRLQELQGDHGQL